MSNDEYKLFKEQLKVIVTKILIETPYSQYKTGRRDFRSTEYNLAPYEIAFKKISLAFTPDINGRMLTDRDQNVYDAQYTLSARISGNYVEIGRLERRPKRVLSFKRKPYQSEESFIHGLLERAVTEAFPAIRIEREYSDARF